MIIARSIFFQVLNYAVVVEDQKDLKLSERFTNVNVGNVIDRDLQAALNLKKYGQDVLKRSVA